MTTGYHRAVINVYPDGGGRFWFRVTCPNADEFTGVDHETEQDALVWACMVIDEWRGQHRREAPVLSDGGLRRKLAMAHPTETPTQISARMRAARLVRL